MEKISAIKSNISLTYNESKVNDLSRPFTVLCNISLVI